MASPDPPAAAAKRATFLRQAIEEHNDHYYVEDAPAVSDAEYDGLFRELQALEQQYPSLATPESPTQRVGGAVVAAFDSVTHRVPMLSLNNAFTDEEVEAFDRRVREALDLPTVEYAVEPKFDGLAISLTYEHGQFTVGATRGDGNSGENVTANLRTVGAVPLALRGDAIPPLLEVRGEVLMLKRDFEALNEAQSARGDKTFVNPRYAAAGAVAPARREDHRWPPTRVLRVRRRHGRLGAARGKCIRRRGAGDASGADAASGDAAFSRDEGARGRARRGRAARLLPANGSAA